VAEADNRIIKKTFLSFFFVPWYSNKLKLPDGVPLSKQTDHLVARMIQAEVDLQRG
jgi:hypothetical protein